MATYIEKEKLMDEIKSKDFISDQVKMLICYIISRQPDSDVMPVVRCGKCKHYDLKAYCSCKRFDTCTDVDDYCSEGERREASKVKPRRIPWEAD